MRFSEDQMKHVLRPGVAVLSDMFTKNGFEIRVVGGAVRDLLMNIIPNDLDFATTATTDQMEQMFERENIRIINLSGKKHGTITARIEEDNFECTTLQTEVVRGKRDYSKWELDAGRRDFTVNALFLDLDGVIYDYFEGTDHLKNSMVLFVENPDERIQENYIRILRYFRFCGKISSSAIKYDAEALDSIQRNSEGLSKISGESLWTEVKKVIGGKFGVELLLKMVECGVGIHIGLPKDFNSENVDKVHKQITGSEKSDFHPCTLLAAGFTNEEDVNHFVERTKCSNRERDTLLYIIRNRQCCSQMASIKAIQDLLVDMVYKDKKTKDLAVFLAAQLVKYIGRTDLLSEINSELIPHFPIKGGMLVDKVPNRKRIQAEMRHLLEAWKDSNYSLGTEDLINKIKT